MMTHITTEAAHWMAKKHTEFVNKQIIAAWRAGYAFLYVYADKYHPETGEYIPSNRVSAPRDDEPYQIRYDLRRVTIDCFQEK